MRYKKRSTCSRIRILGNGMMAAGFLVLCVAMVCMEMPEAASWANGMSVMWGTWNLPNLLAAWGGLLLAAGFLIKLFGWRCPRCGTHLMLCAEKRVGECPYCGQNL